MLNAPHKVHVLKGMIHKNCLEVMDVRLEQVLEL